MPKRPQSHLSTNSPEQGGSPDLHPQNDAEDVREEIGATLGALMPWGVSILVHMGLVVLAFFLVWQTIVAEERPKQAPQVGISETPSAPVKIESNQPSKDPASSSAAFIPVVDPTMDVEPVTPGFNQPRVKAPVQGDWGEGLKQGPSRGKTEGPGLFDIPPGGNATRIVYLVDASGSMVDVLPFVINELKRVINQLEPRHEVTVLFFSGEGVFEVAAGGKATGLRSADPRFKAEATRWVTLDNHAFRAGGRGSKHVKQALTRALSYEPEVVFLLSDNLTGGGLGATQHELFQDDLLGLIAAQNKSTPAARINTLQFLYEDPLVRAGLRGTLDRIADETGGAYRFISQRELHLR
ncbi:MAG: hypothetical protein ACE37H_03290 [Phycisphaeraceae bacterium]